jgi:hypothetical protein
MKIIDADLSGLRQKIRNKKQVLVSISHNNQLPKQAHKNSHQY